MTVFRYSNIRFALSATLLGIIAIFHMTGVAVAAAPGPDLHQLCSEERNDDTIRAYSHALYGGTVEAFKKLFPAATATPDEAELKTQAHYRCMNGKIMVCFVGANLPCVKMNNARNNPGSVEFCRQHRNEDNVPAFAIGHDAVFSYRCRNGRAEIVSSAWKLDERGFAKKLWTVLPDD
ncbi:hypothetical protein J2X72_003579 [Phyllobacterium sp. 1468]|uniref:hypothetical protein n=1 Tax=Phyllobacterium sp. 1468 TaxID=2817759 RepID=UPI002864AC6B|nr:hypothetical protein [Phyllobacterium sp. 1468]MDR6634767.1 hypothetical protein [Phyllobacterium sp. 1468]